MKSPLAAYGCGKGGFFVTGSYQVILGDSNIGTAVVEQHGLYYHIFCNCVFAEKDIYTISVQSGEHCEYLGVCIPEGKHYRLEKSVPMKRFPTNKLFFSASRKSEKNELAFVPLETGGRFSYLSELMTAKFRISDNKQGIVICSKTAVQ